MNIYKNPPKRRRWVDIYKIIVTLAALAFGGIIVYRVLTEGGSWVVGIIGGVLIILGIIRARTIINYYRETKKRDEEEKQHGRKPIE
jgi:uncharacterized BrkB/YihY/UPF0761 family membrane protein